MVATQNKDKKYTERADIAREMLEYVNIKTTFVCTIKRERGRFLCAPQDKKIYINFAIPQKDSSGAKINQKVVVELERWIDYEKAPIGKVIKIIGEAGVHETEMQSILLDRGFSSTFPREVEKEAEHIKKNYANLFQKEEKSRKDFRDVPTFTIDPVDAKDFDDALSLKKLPNGNFEIGIHIADVSFFVGEGSLIDKEAMQRSTSIYLVDRTIPMLPEILSNDICSLNPNEDKLTFSAVFEITSSGEILKKWFGRTIIKSKKRFTYEEAESVLDKKHEGVIFSEELTILQKIAKSLRKKRFDAGAIEFEQDEVKFELDKDGRPLRIIKKERLESNRTIEDFMILANAEVAKFATNKNKVFKKTFVYRVHDLPDEDKMTELMHMLRAFGYKAPKKKSRFEQKDIAELLRKVKGESYEGIVQQATIQAMAKAIYSTKNIGHFGLSLKTYTHFTSPIRRYPDVMVHRLLARLLADKPIPKEELYDYEALSRVASQMEVTATDAERESIKYKQAEYMSERIGDKYKGIIVGLTERGMFVRLNDTLTEGMIRMRDMKDDYYKLDETGFKIVGEKTKKIYTIGDKINVRILRVNVEKRLIDFAFEN